MSAQGATERGTAPAMKTLPSKALRGAGRIARQHKVATAIGAAFAAATVAVSLIGSRPGAPPAHPVAPGFNLTALGDPGKHITLSQYKGKPLIVNFWASWCSPCQRETPLIAGWYKQQHGHVIVVGLDVNDDAAKALQFARAKGVSYPVGVDPALAATNAYGVVVLPQTFFLNAQHRIVDHLYGPVTQADLAKGVRLMDASGS